MMAKRKVRIEFKRWVWAVVYMDRNKYQRYWAAQFDAKQAGSRDRAVEWVKASANLELVE